MEGLRLRSLKTGATGLVAAGLIATASPASASTSDCTGYLSDLGYSVGSGVTGACEQGASGNTYAYVTCYVSLLDLGVTPSHSDTACYLADR